MQRTAIVTGAGRGIGLEVARQLLLAGHRVALLDVSDEALAGARSQLEALAAKALFLRCDAGDEAQVRRAVEQVRGQLGAIGILVNNAGVSANKPFVEMDASEYRRLIDVNYVGVLHGCREVLPSMIEARWGRIVNVASDAARVGTPREAVYAGAKAAVIGFTKSLAAEVASAGITANVVCPGTTDTELLRATLNEEQIARRMKANPSGRIGTVADVAAAALFFASEAAGYVNGQVLSVSGGITRVG